MPARPVPSPPLSTPVICSLFLLAVASCARVVGQSAPDQDGGGGGNNNVTTTPDAANDPRPAPDVPAHPDTGGCIAGSSSAGGGCGLCGNGVLNLPDEACDDGNTTGGDGCSA